MNGRDIPRKWFLIAVRLGEWDTAATSDCETYVDEKVCNDPTDITIELAVTHEHYDPFSFNLHNDIALLRLSRKVEYTAFITPICLPFDLTSRSAGFENQTLSVAGWGQTETRMSSNIKLKVNVDGFSTSDCQMKYARKSVEIKESQICAGGELGYDSW